MKRTTYLLLASLAACGGGDPDTTADRRVIDVPDAGPGLPDTGPGPDASLNPEECNTTQQNCQDPVLSKCTVIFNGATFETECLEPTGMLAEGDTCVRDAEGNPGVGHDPCAAGLFCSGIALPTGPPPERACRKFCDSDLNCTVALQKCLSLDGDGPLQGICVPTCTLFDSATCVDPVNMSCSISINNNGADGMGTCRMNGIKVAGNACAGSQECSPNMNCISDGAGGGICANLCDAAHACPAGESCTAVPPLPNGGGFCQ